MYTTENIVNSVRVKSTRGEDYQIRGIQFGYHTNVFFNRIYVQKELDYWGGERYSPKFQELDKKFPIVDFDPVYGITVHINTNLFLSSIQEMNKYFETIINFISENNL